MTREQLLRLVRESRQMLESATPEQKLRLLALIREGYRSLQPQQPQQVLLQENADYLDEK